MSYQIHNSRRPQYPVKERLSRVKELAVNTALKLIELDGNSSSTKGGATELFCQIFPKVFTSITGADPDGAFQDDQFYDDEEPYEQQPPKPAVKRPR